MVHSKMERYCIEILHDHPMACLHNGKVVVIDVLTGNEEQPRIRITSKNKKRSEQGTTEL